jgi:hypothetical protein
MDSGIRGMRFPLISVLLLCAMVVQTHAATITVTNTNDSGPGSLRQAVANANDGDTINFAVTGNIGLIGVGLSLDKSVTISGPGADRLSIDGNHAGQSVFSTVAGEVVRISGLTIRNSGVGISNSGSTLTVTGCVITQNSSGGLPTILPIFRLLC